MTHVRMAWRLAAGVALLSTLVRPASAQTTGQTWEQIEAGFQQHKAEFDYLLWATGNSAR